MKSEIRNLCPVICCLLSVIGILGCASSAELNKCQTELRRVQIDLQTAARQINELSQALKESAKTLDTVRFEMNILRKQLLNLTQPTQPIPSEEITALVNRLQQKETETDKVVEQLKPFGKQAVIALTLSLKQPDPAFRQRLEQVLVQMPAADVVAVLSESLKDPEVRLSAARVLGNLGNPSAVPVLAGYTGDEKPDFAFSIAEALLKLKDKRGIPGLIEALKSDNSSRRVLAYDLLTKVTHKDFNYKPYLSEAERLKGVREWEEWWTKEGQRFEFDK
jgi:HEAT repeat protein